MVGSALVLLAFLLRLRGLGWGLPEVYEEATPLYQAWDMWQAGAASFDPNPHFFNYPSLLIYLHLLWQVLQLFLYKMFGLISGNLDFQVLVEIEKTPVFYAGRLLTTLLGTGTVWLVFQLGRRLAGLTAGAVAAFLLAINTFHIDQSQIIAVDVPLTFFVCAALLAMTRLGPESGWRDHLWTGLLIGLATSAKYTGAVLVVPCLAAYVVTRWSTLIRPGRISTKTRLLHWRPVVVGGLVAVTVFALTSPFVVLDFQAALQGLAVERNHMQQGHFGLGSDTPWHFYGGRLGGSLLGWPILLAAAGGVWFGAVRRRPDLLVVPVGFLLVSLGPISTWTMKADRYLLPAIPVLIVLAGCGVGGLVTVLRRRNWSTRLVVAGAVGLTLACAIPTGLAYSSLLARSRPDTRTTSLRWFEEHVPAGSFILMEYFGPELLRPTNLLPLDRELQDRLLTGKSRRPVYAVQMLPLFQSRPAVSAVYYDLAHYPDADYVVISGSVRSRYARDPVRFAKQMSFYAAVENQWNLAAEFLPGQGAGPTLRIFRNPHWDQPYVDRPAAAPVPLPPSPTGQARDEGFQYFSLGANAMSFEHPAHAEQAFRIGLQYRPLRREVAFNLVLGMIRVLEDTGRRGEVAAFLDSLGTSGRTDLNEAVARLQAGF